MTRDAGARPSRVILTYGRFDLFHQGHVEFLRKAASFGTELIVGLTTDIHARKSGLPCHTPYEDRRDLLQHCRYVSRVIPDASAAQKRTDIVNYNVCILVLASTQRGAFESLTDITQIRYLPREPILRAQAHLNELAQPLAIR